MRVIKPGRQQRGWSKEFECTGQCNGGGGCGAVLLVEQADLYKISYSCMGESETSITFRCCSCGVETDVNREYTGSWSDLVDKKAWMKNNPPVQRDS